MQFDDRLATVLRSGAAGEHAARTQYRQLLDLLGSAPSDADGPLVQEAYVRLGEIEQVLAPSEQARILCEPWLRLRNPHLLIHLAAGDPQVSAAAIAAARLEEEEWLALVPQLPHSARGFLRHRSDIPDTVRALVARQGIGDLFMPRPASLPDEAIHIVDAQAEPDDTVPESQRESEPEPEPEPEPLPDPEPEQDSENESGDDIAALVRRIEAFRQARRDPPAISAPTPPPQAEPPAPPAPAPGPEPEVPAPVASSGPAPEEPASAETAPRRSCDVTIDAGGRIDWAEADLAPMLVGMRLAAAGVLDAASRRAQRLHQPVRGGTAVLEGAPAIAGEWRVDAAPVFAAPRGTFAGYRARLRRPLDVAETHAPSAAGDRMRQMLHELRTPVNAVQGFAEIIQQQLFGPVPNSYRALAAAIGVDSARLLAGFDEIDRMVRLDSSTAGLSADGASLRQVVERTLKRLEGALRPRSARMRLLTSGGEFAVRLGREDLDQLVWRVLATFAGALAPGEIVELALRDEGQRVTLTLELPIALAAADDPFEGATQSQTPAVTAGMFGSGFTLRLARAESEAAGGSLALSDEALVLTLPSAIDGALQGAEPRAVAGR